MTTKLYRKYFSEQRILIADDSSISRISIARGLTELGATSSIISLAESFDAAQGFISSQSFTIVITEFDLGSHNGIELINAVRRKTPGALTAMITKNQSEAAAAVAAENDIDLFIRKPFSMDVLQKTFSEVIADRTDTSGATGPDRALNQAIEALQRSKDYKRIYDRVGYRALIQLYDSLMREGNKSDAYLVLRRLVTTFPLHPERLSMILRLAIETRNWDDVDNYYSLFLGADAKSDELIRHVYAALVSSGKAALASGMIDAAMKRFKWASLASGKKSAVLREIALSLANAGRFEEADSFLAVYPQHERQFAEYLTLDYFIMSKSQPLHLVLQRGRELLKNGHEHPVIYEILINACKGAGHHAEAESLAMDAARRCPTPQVSDASNTLDAKPIAQLPIA